MSPVANEIEVSVIVPFHGAAPWWNECITTLINQRYVDEIILIDDGADISVREAIQNYITDIPKIRLIAHPNRQNEGRSKSRNLGILHARGKWVAFCDIDDYWLPDRLTDLPLTDCSVDGYYGIIDHHYEQNRAIENHDQTTQVQDSIAPTALFDHLTRERESRFSIISLVVRRSCLLMVGGFDERMDFGEDTDLIWRLAYRYRLRADELGRSVATRRVHDDNSYANEALLTARRYRFYRKWYFQRQYKFSKAGRRRVVKSYLYYHPFFCSIRHFIQKLFSK